MSERIFAVIGAGAWGTALAIQLAQDNRSTLLWSHCPEHITRLQAERENQAYLPGIKLPGSIEPIAHLAACIERAADILVVVPSSAFRQTLQHIKPLLNDQHRLAWGTKGLEQDSRRLLHQMVRDDLAITHPCAALSGPTFANEVARGLPGAITVASKDHRFAEDLAGALHHGYFRTYTSPDISGVELGGAVKNVLAIAAGISDGLGFGINTRAALITRGLAEMTRLGVAMGGQRETFMGLSGLGDLVLTCSDDQSRNRRMGLALGQGKRIEQAKTDSGKVVEGVTTAKAVYHLARELQVSMPISEQVYRVLYEDLAPRAAVQNLMERAPRAEAE
ncbi:MAG: NAD(P)-dependent glycerol-3-phosphate dehydrogenase [Gammaproteobacteria bacterium]|nr:NAD(P)-dependent glycerol-3-phosphate dehydrogenase [Gammaproteobacteria bacterium]